MSWKKNVLVLAGMSTTVAVASMGALMFGSFPLEINLLLVSIVAACGGGNLVLAGQVATDSPPNPHQDELNHQYRMRQLDDACDNSCKV